MENIKKTIVFAFLILAGVFPSYSQSLDVERYIELTLQAEQFKFEVNQKRVVKKLVTLKDSYALDRVCLERLESFIADSIQKNDKDYWDEYGIRVAKQMEIGDKFNKGREIFLVMKYSQNTPLTTLNSTIFQKLYMSNASALRGIYKNHYTHQSCKVYYDLKTENLYILHLFLGTK